MAWASDKRDDRPLCWRYICKETAQDSGGTKSLSSPCTRNIHRIFLSLILRMWFRVPTREAVLSFAGELSAKYRFYGYVTRSGPWVRHEAGAELAPSITPNPMAMCMKDSMEGSKG